MTTLPRLRSPVALSLPACAAAFSALALSHATPVWGIVALPALALAGALVLWPWAAVPAAVLGGAFASQVLGLDRVGSIVAVHSALVALGFLAVLIRRGIDPLWGGRVKTAADVPMLALAGTVALGALPCARDLSTLIPLPLHIPAVFLDRPG